MKIIQDEYGYIFKDEDISDAADATAFAAAKIKKPISNADRLVSKTPEEMAEWFNSYFTCPPKTTCPMGEASCEKCWLEWLKQEAKDA